MPALPTSGPLKGIRILDLTWILSGPMCTQTLGDLGADVIKLERPPYGDVARTTMPMIDGESGYFFSINRGKRSIAVDLTTESGKSIFKDLIKEVDVVVENFTPGAMDRLGLGYTSLKDINPKLIYAAISGYGQTGPLRDKPALDVIVQGAGGVMSITGYEDSEPARVGFSVGDVAAGLYCAVGVLAAIHEREKSGEGQLIDISMLDCQIAVQTNEFMRYHITKEIPGRIGTRHPTAVPFQAFPTKDGYIVIALSWGISNQWGLLCVELDIPELIDDPRFETAAARSRNHSELEPLLNSAFAQKHTSDWVNALQKYGIPCGPLNNIAETSVMPQVAAREMLPEIDHKTFGATPLANTPIKMSRTPGGIKGTAPDMGEHSREVLSELLGMSEGQLADLISNEVVWEERPEVELG
ncbi:MAG: CaiB/BaiF CoA-transferase family protein [Dehalococcoidia bacterium]|nr:CaiB/BaiF CoA-transferase family protein [Dehalococcoidia bacterium]